MKRVTVVFDDDELYRAIKVEAARTGRTIKDLLMEALRARLDAGQGQSRRERRRAALDAAARLRATQRPSSTSIVEEVRAIRGERLDSLESH